MTDTEATTPKVEKTPEQKAQQHAVRAIARALSKLEGGSPEETKTRWSEGKAKFTADARKVAKVLNKDGVTFELDESKTSKARRATKKSQKTTEAAAED